MPPVVRSVASRGRGDCAVIALAMYLERSYEDVLAAAASVTKSSMRTIADSGLYTHQIRRTAAALGHPLRLRRAIDMDADEGIVGFTDAKRAGHVAYIKQGMVWGMIHDQWEHEAYCAHYKYRAVSLLVTA